MIGEILELRRLLKNRKLSSDELEDLQMRKLRAVIRHSYEKVPYYRSLFRSAGLSPEDIRAADDLKHVPITTKDDLRAAGVERIIAKDLQLSSCTSVPTSGTTGKPFTTYLTRNDLKTRRLIEFRTLLSIGFRPRDRLAVLGPEWPHRSRLHQHLGLYRNMNISPFFSIADQVRHLQRMQPTVFWAYPTFLRALLNQIDYRLSKLVHPRMLITSAEVLDNVMSERIRADLDLEIFNFYASNEIGRIAAECPSHEGLHVNADHVILECLEGNWPVEPGTAGVAVLTTLNAFAIPFIRYRLGDICTFIEKRCSCGCVFPLIQPPRGREEDMIRLPSGKILSPWGFSFILRIFDSINQFRLIQESFDHLTLQLVFRGNPQDETLIKIRSRFMEYLGESVRLDIQTVDFIKEEKLKFRTFISKLPKSDL